MTLEQDLRYVLDRIAIQDLVAAYGLGQDLLQAGQDNDVLAQWDKVFAPDVVIDASTVGARSDLNLHEYAELLRGPALGAVDRDAADTGRLRHTFDPCPERRNHEETRPPVHQRPRGGSPRQRHLPRDERDHWRADRRGSAR